MRTMTCQLTDDTADALDLIAQHQGVTVTALVEALGDCLAEHVPDDPAEPMEGTIDVFTLIRHARQIAHDRRRRT